MTINASGMTIDQGTSLNLIIVWALQSNKLMKFQLLNLKTPDTQTIDVKTNVFLFPGDGCVDKPLSTLWRNHISSEKADILMKVSGHQLDR